MSYNALAKGNIRLSKSKTYSKVDIEEFNRCIYEMPYDCYLTLNPNETEILIQFSGDNRFDDGQWMCLFSIIKPSVKYAEILFTGEDGLKWKYFWRDGSWWCAYAKEIYEDEESLDKYIE